MARKTAEEAERTRQRILASGAQVFALSGFSCATLEIIAKQAGLSRGAVYWHFKGKEELLLAVLQDITLPVERFFSAGMNLQCNIQRLYAAIEQTLIKVESRQLCEILLKKNESIAGANPITERLHLVQRSFTAQMQHLLKSAISNGEVDPTLDIDATCRMFQMYLSGLFFESLQGSFDVPRHIKMTLNMISDVLFKPPPHLLSASNGRIGSLLS
jgi:AcrR family transcriptional regulator